MARLSPLGYLDRLEPPPTRKERRTATGVLEQLTTSMALPSGPWTFCFDAAIGFRVRNSTYRAVHAGEITGRREP